MTRGLAGFVFACVLAGSALASAEELRVAFDARPPGVSLLGDGDAVPAAMRKALEDGFGGQLRESEGVFLADVERSAQEREELSAGGGARGRDPDTSWLAFLLGLVPGFGLGHFLFSHDSAAGTRWLVIDVIFLVIWVVLDVAVSAAYPYGYSCDPYGRCYYGGGWGLWWLLFDLVLPVGWIIEHVFQGLSAYRAASGRSLVGESEPPPVPGTFALEPRRTAPNLFAWGF